MRTVELSVIIVSYNTCEMTLRCLELLLAAVENIKYEIIVVDNNSVDDTALKIQSKYPCVKLIKNDTNVGFAKAVNQALTVCSGQYVLLLNSDLELSRDNIARLIHTMEASGAGICGGILKNDSGHPQVSFGNFLTMGTLFTESFSLPERLMGIKLKKLGHKIQLDKSPFEVDYVSGACLLAKRNLIEDIGLLDENFFMYFEEMDWCKRAKDKGWRIVCDPGCQPVHFMSASFGGSSGKYNPIRDRIFYTSLLVYSKKHHISEFIVRLDMVTSAIVKLGYLCLNYIPRIRWRNLTSLSLRKELFKIKFFLRVPAKAKSKREGV